MMQTPVFILASGSPRRQELLARIGLPFSITAPDVDETVDVQEPDMVRILAIRKAQAARDRLPNDHPPVLAADTVVWCDGTVYGKPHDASDARRMLTQLSGRWHDVYTGICVLDNMGRTETWMERTRVLFTTMSDREIQTYVATEEPMDKAGAYAIQGYGSWFVDKIDGSYTNVIGLPLSQARAMLLRFLPPEIASSLAI